MNETEKATIRALIRRLEGEDMLTAPEVRTLLTSPPLAGFLRSWVTGPLRLLVKENRTRHDLRAARAAAE